MKMSTLLESEGICGWCGKYDAPLKCACKQISFCDKTCQKKLWKEHILMCPKAKKKDPSKFSTGDIAKIKGLQSEQGKRMNGLLAEIISFNEEKKRYQVIFTMENCVVKTALLKHENLAMHLSVLEGAKGCSRAKKSELGSPERQEEYINECKKVAQNVSKNRTTGKEIMDGLKKNEKDLLQAISMKGGIDLTPKQTEEMLKNGFIDWVFGHFEYPAVIDETDRPPLSLDCMLAVATNVLNKDQLGFGFLGFSKEHHLNQYRVEACKKMAPLIMAVATKKRRLFRHVEYWVSVQFGFGSLLQNCLLADRLGSAALLNQLDPFVTQTLLNHCVDLFSSNPSLYLRKNSGVMQRDITRQCLENSMKMVLMPSLMELMDDNNVGERWVTHIGKINIPPGKKNMSHKPFAASVYRLFAQAAVEEISTPKARRGGQQLLEEIQYMYSCMNRCGELREIMGPFNYELAAVETPLQLLQWAHETLESSA